MALISDFFGGVALLVLRLLFALAAAVFAVSLLLAGLLTVVFVLLRALLTGRKPAAFVVWQRFRQAASWTPRTRPGAAPSGPGARVVPADDVVDVPSRDVTPR